MITVKSWNDNSDPEKHTHRFAWGREASSEVSHPGNRGSETEPPPFAHKPHFAHSHPGKEGSEMEPSHFAHKPHFAHSHPGKEGSEMEPPYFAHKPHFAHKHWLPPFLGSGCMDSQAEQKMRLTIWLAGADAICAPSIQDANSLYRNQLGIERGVGVGWGAVIGTAGVWSDTAGFMRGDKVETEAC